MNVTVLGATGGIGRAITLELAARGHAVTAAARSAAATPWPAGVTATPTDVTDPVSARDACTGADVVVMAAQVPYPRWHTELVPLFDAAADAAAAAEARLVVVDNLYAYGSPDGPITEATPERPDTRKGAIRSELGRRLLARHADGEQRVAIGRFSDYYGAHADNSLVWMLGIATMVEQPDADGRSWVLPAAPAITQRALYDLLDASLDRPARRGHVTLPMLRTLGLFDRQMREAVEMRGQFTRPWITDASAFEAAFGPVPLTSHADALAASVAAARAATQPAVTA
jgi:NAD(P)-dependent dehydrogenase (short-subunit alcohol dehydrogenase family)